MRILKEEGVEPHHIYVGHLSNTLDPDYHRELARLGVWLGWDINTPFGSADLPPWRERTDYLKERLDEGLATSMMMSHDWNIVLSRISTSGTPGRQKNPDGYSVAEQGGHSPANGCWAIPAVVIDRMMVDNPRTYFEGGRPTD